MKHICHTTCTHQCACDKVMKWLFCSDASFWKSLLIWSPTMTVENTAQLSEAFHNNQKTSSLGGKSPEETIFVNET